MSLVSALLVMVIVSMAIALIGYLMVGSMKVSHELKVFKTTREAAEGVAFAVIGDIDEGNLQVQSGCSVDCAPDETGCPIELPPEIENALEDYISVNATLLRNCTDGVSQIYTILVEAEAKDGTKTRIYFIYQK